MEPMVILEQGWDFFKEIASGKTDTPVQQSAPMPGATPDGKPSAESFVDYAREVAVREVAVVDEELAPIQETPPDSPDAQEERSWGDRYQTHITLISTVVGLGTFVAWLLLRKGNDR
ncbi:MAG: hypothetical protein ACYSWO_19740 [Planctomycetota bacterium]